MGFRLKIRKVTCFSERTPPHVYFLHLPKKSVLSASTPIRLHQIQSKFLVEFHFTVSFTLSGIYSDGAFKI